MTKKMSYFIVLFIFLFIIGCQPFSGKEKVETNNPQTTEEKSGGENMSQYDIFNFRNIEKAPEATTEHQMNEVIKIFFDEWSFDEPYKAVAVDIANNEIYVNPIISQRGLRAEDGVVQISNATEVIHILDKYSVQDWKTDNMDDDSGTYEDGDGWELLLQYEDGTVKKHLGNEDALKPEKFNDFAEELYQFIDEQLEGSEI